MIKRLLNIFKPLLSFVFLRNPERVSRCGAVSQGKTLSGMVTEFNVLHHFFLNNFFERVQYLPEDIKKVKSLSGPVVYVMKNRGQLEYQYFNYLFLKEKISPVQYSNNSLTLFWWPLKKAHALFVSWLKNFYEAAPEVPRDASLELSHVLEKDQNALLNLSISRDYLFGLIRTNPLDVLSPLIAIQKQMAKPIHVVTLQFLYDKHPDKTQRSYFDLLFGDKSCPGALRKFLLFIMNYRRRPNVKFGIPLPLSEFLNTQSPTTEADAGQALLTKIEQDLEIERARITGPKLRSKEAVIKEIMTSSFFMDGVQALADQQKRKPDEIKKEALKYLHEIAADVDYSYVHFAHVTLGYVWNNIYDGVVIKRDQLNRVREIAGKNPVVLVPMHRSHIDYMLISDIFYENNITYPYVCGGINLNFWPVGRLIRKCGGFFIRRSFDGNKLYKESLYAYMRSLLSFGHCIEFYIEGTRSRTGKLLKPKMGILSLIMRAFFEGACEDIYFVPIAVNYDNILEQKSYQQEGEGAEKSKENAGELLKARKIFNKKKYGKVYIEFADPISLKGYCAKHAIQNKPIDELKKEVNDFAYHLTYHINKVALVTPIAMVSLAILSLNKHTFGFEEILQRIALFRDYLDFKGVTYSDLINYSDRYAYNEAIKKLAERHILKQVDTFEESFYRFEDRHRLVMDYYKNNILHFFVSLTCFLKILNSQENYAAVTLDTVIKQFEIVKTLFRHDFTFSERATIKEHIVRVIDYTAQRGLVGFDEESGLVTKTITNANFNELGAFECLLDNFLESHLLALRYLRVNAVEKAEKKTLIKDILLKARPMYLKEDLTHPEALSQFNLENTLKVFCELGILRTEKTDEKYKTYYTSTREAELIDRWIVTIQNLIKVFPPLGDARTFKPENPIVTNPAAPDLH